MNVLGQVMEAGDEKGARDIFDIFDTLLILVCLHSLLMFAVTNAL